VEWEVYHLIFSIVCDKSVHCFCQGDLVNLLVEKIKKEEKSIESLVVGMMILVFLVAGSAFGAEPIKLGMSTWLGYAPYTWRKKKVFRNGY
jgi:hypothetical protein